MQVRDYTATLNNCTGMDRTDQVDTLDL